MAGMGLFMKKRSFSALILAFSAMWATSASATPTTATRGVSKGKLRSFTTPAEIKANTTIPANNGGGGPSTGGSGSSASGANGTNFGFGRPLKKPLVKPKVKPKARPKE